MPSCNTIRPPFRSRRDTGRPKTRWFAGPARGSGRQRKHSARCNGVTSTRSPRTPPILAHSKRLPGNAAVVTVRLKVVNRKVAEAEWYLARKGDPGIGVGASAQANNAFWDPENLAAHPPVERVVPKAERVSREDLIAITNSYFDSLS